MTVLWPSTMSYLQVALMEGFHWLFGWLEGGGGNGPVPVIILGYSFFKVWYYLPKKPCDGTILSHREYSSTLRTVRKVLAEFAESI